MFFVTNTATNTSTAAFFTWNQEIYNKIIYCNNLSKDWTSKIDHIIQAIEAIAELKDKTEELIRIADIINNTIADTKTDTLIVEERYYTNINTQFYKIAKILRLILHNALLQQFHTIQCNLVNELTVCQGHRNSVINNYIYKLQESYTNTNQFPTPS